jgi:ribosomal protein L37AE/L43A
MIKQHRITGKVYLCKSHVARTATTSYLGSGKKWKNHINKHGKEYVETIWFCWFFEKEPLIECALMLSKLYDVINSDIWYNQMFETGIDGMGSPGRNTTDKTKQLISKKNTGRKFTCEVNSKKSNPGDKNGMYGVHRNGHLAPRYGKPMSDAGKLKSSISAKNRTRIKCPHCSFEVDISNASRWHFDRCIKNPNISDDVLFQRKYSGRCCRITDRKEMDYSNFMAFINHDLSK